MLTHIRKSYLYTYCGLLIGKSKAWVSLDRARTHQPTSELCRECKVKVIEQDHKELLQKINQT